MNDKLNLPESVWPGKHYSFRADMKLNAWAIVAVVLAFISRIVLRHHADWNTWLRALVALSPLVAGLLYVRSVARWIRGMDELQRRIQLEACLFATIATIFISMALELLNAHGIHLPRFMYGLGGEGTFASIVFFYFVGNLLINRRYK